MLNLILWFIKNSEGITIFDKCILFFLKIIYLGSRILLRLVLGKKRRDRLYVERGLDFGVFWYKSFKFLRPGNSSLLKFKVPKYNYEFYCRVNKDDFKIMTIHEDDIIEHFTPKQGDIVVDIGAHIGLYTIIASKRVGANGKVVAIEANPGNFEMLNRNIKVNQLTNIISLNNAVYSKETKLKLYLPGEELGHTTYNTVMSDRAKNEDKFVEVSANTLDYLLQLKEITDVNWVKIDVEGAEFEVLKGAHDLLLNSRNIVILMEVHGSLNDYRLKLEEFIRSYNLKIEFEKIYENTRYIIVRKSA